MVIMMDLEARGQVGLELRLSHLAVAGQEGQDLALMRVGKFLCKKMQKRQNLKFCDRGTTQVKAVAVFSQLK